MDVATKSTDIPSNFQQDEEKKQKSKINPSNARRINKSVQYFILMPFGFSISLTMYFLIMFIYKHDILLTVMTARSKIPRRTKQSARNAEQVKAATKTPLASVEKRKNKRNKTILRPLSGFFSTSSILFIGLTTPRDWAKIHQQQFEKYVYKIV